MDIVFKAKHWQIFGTFFLLALIDSMIDGVNPIASDVSNTIVATVNIVWISLLGFGLSRRLKTLNSTGFKMFKGAGLLLIVSIGFSELLISTKLIEVEGHSILFMIFLGIYAITLLAVIFSYLAKTLKQLETNDEIDINDYFGDIFLILFWPIGIWTIQPRLNKLTEFKTD